MATLFISGYPFIQDNTSGTSVTASGSLNQSGELYSVILPEASGAPSAQQVYDGQNADSGVLAANFRSSGVLVSSSGSVVELSGYSLSSETDYTMYIVGSGYSDNDLTSVEDLDFTTPDVTAPSFTAGYPQVTNITTNSANVILNMNDAGSGYFVIVPQSESAPSAANIRAGLNYNGDAVPAGRSGSTALVASTSATITATGLDYSTLYTMYATGRDDGNNDIASVSSVNFRAAVPNPGVVRGQFSARDIRRRNIRRAQLGMAQPR